MTHTHSTVHAMRLDVVEGARRWCSLWGGGSEIQPTPWASTHCGCRPTQVRDGFLQGACEAPTAFVPTLKVALVNRRCNCMQCVGLVAVPAHVVLVVTCGSVAIVVSST